MNIDDTFALPPGVDESDMRAPRAGCPDIPRARATDPATSKAAAKSMRAVVWDHHANIIGVLWRPMHVYDIAKFTGLSHVQVGKRMSELIERGEVRLTLDADGKPKTVRGDSGRQCQLYERILPAEKDR